MEKRKRNFVEWAMHYRQIVILITACLVAFGIYSLPQMRKNEFPDFTVRQGMVVAVAPGVPADEMAEQVTKPLENYIFTYKEVKKEKTISRSRDGIVYVQVELNDEVNDKDAFWSKFKHGVNDFKAQLPSNVLAIKVMDDFGDTSALLITMESQEKTYRELDDYMADLQDSLRRISSVGRMSVSGLRKEQIAVYVDNERLAHYGLTDQALAAILAQKGFTTSGGRVKNSEGVTPLYVSKSLNSVYDIRRQIVYTDPRGHNIRLEDVADVRREYPDPDSYITNNGRKCILLSIEVKKGQNIVKMGEEVNRVITDFKRTIPSEVSISSITDQSRVVSDSVSNFLRELLIAVVAVVIVVMLLLPMRVALVAASTIPITIFISLRLFNAFGLELNTVTLAVLIMSLGMIVDNSIVIIDNYLEKIREGESRWHASITSTTHFFKAITSATLAITVTFFPFLITMTGMMHDFLLTFPWGVTIVLGVSLLVATLLVPFMQFWFIRKPMAIDNPEGRKSFSFLDLLQKSYNKLLDVCFAHPKITVGVGVLSVVVGAWLMTRLPQQLMPMADRNQFAVEIYTPAGTSLERTSVIADSLEHILRRDDRVVSVTSFKGCSSPRFHTAYAPQIAGTDYAQFVVNTTGAEQTVALLDEYAPRYSNYFPGARVRFKQLSYSEAVYPIEIRLSGSNPDTLRAQADRIVYELSKMPFLQQVHTDNRESQPVGRIVMKEDEASRLGVNNLTIESTLAMRYSSGLPVATVWEGDHDIPVMLKSTRADSSSYTDVADERIPVAGMLASVPLRQIADIRPDWKPGQLVRRNGIYTITVESDLQRGVNANEATKRVKQIVSGMTLSSGVSVSYGGEEEQGVEKMPAIMSGLVIAAVIIFFILLVHFRKISIALLIFSSLTLCLFGTALGILIQGIDYSITSVLGITSLMGIIVRNGIIMIDYAEELRATEKLSAAEAIYHSAQRRMRPIFLTSAAASMGVIPMILGKSGLWMPMGTVICYGTLITMVFLLTVLPAAYLLLFRGTTRKRAVAEALEQE